VSGLGFFLWSAVTDRGLQGMRMEGEKKRRKSGKGVVCVGSR